MPPSVPTKPPVSTPVPTPVKMIFINETYVIKKIDSSLISKTLAGLSGVNAFNKKPLVCMAGKDRPPLVAEYMGSGTCNYSQAQKLISLGQQQYHRSCQVPWDQAKARIQEKFTKKQKLDKNDLDYLKRANQRISVDMFTMVKIHPFADLPVKLPVGSQFKFQPATCGEAQYSIPVILNNFGLLQPDKIHPFLNVVFHLNADQLHDFRSTESFKKVAQEMEPILKKSGTKELKVAYPASGSHLAPLMVAFHLMDQGTLDRAKFSFSEIDANSPKRIEAYIDLMAKIHVTLPGETKRRNLITGLWKNTQKDAKGNWSKTIFAFLYRGKPITLVVFKNPEKDKYIPDAYLKNSNLLVLHDLTENFTEQERLLAVMAKFHDNGKAKFPVWVVARDKPKALSQNATVNKFSGKYGCGPVDTTGRLFGDQTWTVRGKGADRSLISGVRSFFDPFEKHSDYSNIKVHHNQKDLPFYLIGWN